MAFQPKSERIKIKDVAKLFAESKVMLLSAHDDWLEPIPPRFWAISIEGLLAMVERGDHGAHGNPVVRTDPAILLSNGEAWDA